MTSERNQGSDGLEAFFQAAADGPGPRDDLIARVLADAKSVQDAPVLAPPVERPRFLQAIGGWIAVSGLAAACAAGLAIGVTLPAAVGAVSGDTLTTILEGRQTLGFTGYDAISFAEGGLGE